MFTDPTERDDQAQPIQGIYYNPYEPATPYYGNAPSIPPLAPPPPPRQARYKEFTMILVSIASLVIILGTIFFTVMYYNAKPGNPSPASSPTASSNGPTTTGPTVGQTTPSSDATAIYNSLIGKLSTTTHHVVAVGSDTAWQGWPYTPERQAFVWHDNNFLFEIAAYSSSNEVVADINYNATTQGTKYQANAIGTCMFLYDSGADSTTPADYFRLLANEQGCQS